MHKGPFEHLWGKVSFFFHLTSKQKLFTLLKIQFFLVYLFTGIVRGILCSFCVTTTKGPANKPFFCVHYGIQKGNSLTYIATYLHTYVYIPSHYVASAEMCSCRCCNVTDGRCWQFKTQSQKCWRTFPKETFIWITMRCAGG